jgi:hypothetical protein
MFINDFIDVIDLEYMHFHQMMGGITAARFDSLRGS